MILVDTFSSELEFDAGEGGHNATLTCRNAEDGVEAAFVMRPDSALALAEALRVWASTQIKAGGFF